MKRILLATSIFVAGVCSAIAADLPVKSRAIAPLDSTPCTTTSCSGFYLGLHVEGEGSNADIIGSGINGSIFNNGAGLGVHAGYQFWNGSFFVAGEVGGSYYTGSNSFLASIAGINPNWSVDTVVKLGYGLNGLFNGPPAPSSGPVTPIQALNGAMLSPFFTVGERFRDRLNGFVAGGGICYTLGGPNEACAEYRHVTYDKTTAAGIINIGSEQSVMAEFNHKF